MGKYEYNFVEVPFDGDLKSGNAETIEKGIDKQQQLCHCF